MPKTHKHLASKKPNKAPLVLPDTGRLGDKKLGNPLEFEAKEKEDTRKAHQKNKIANQDELEDQERSAGPRMAPNEFIRRVKNENSQLIVRDGGVPGAVALYVYVEPRAREEGNEDEPFKYVGGFKWEPLPEFAHVINDEWGVAKREYRGWRSVLIGLIKAKVLTYRQAVDQFGEPLGSRGNLWHQQLRDYK